MDHLVCIENTTYHHWQVELLIQSFKNFGLEDHLVVAIAEDFTPQFQDFTKNLHQHERKFMHENVGRPLNRIHGIRTALDNRLIEQPFYLLHADMLLHRPIDDEDLANILYAIDRRPAPHFSQFAEGFTVNPGGAMRFKTVPRSFFASAGEYMKQLTGQYEPSLISKLGWMLAMYQYQHILEYKPAPYETTLHYHNTVLPFIHYGDGMAPHFNKQHYLFESHFSMGSSPFDALLSVNPNSTTDYVQSVVKSYLEID